MDCSLTGSSVHGFLQAKILEWISISFRRSSWPRDWTRVSCISGRFFTISATIKRGLHSDWNHLKESRINGQCLLPLRSEVGVYWWGGRLIHFTLFSYCSIVDLQCCASSRCIAPWTGSSVHRISQARILEAIAISFSGGSSQPRDQTHISSIGR